MFGHTMPFWKTFLYFKHLSREMTIVDVVDNDNGKALFNVYMLTGTLMMEPIKPSCEFLCLSSHICPNAILNDTKRSSS